MPRTEETGADFHLTTIRVPRDLHAWLTERAARNERAVSGEIRFLLAREREAEEKADRVPAAA